MIKNHEVVVNDIPIFGSRELHHEIRIWCNNQFGYEGWYNGYWGWADEKYMCSGPLRGQLHARYEFVLLSDATQFKLRWLP